MRNLFQALRRRFERQDSAGAGNVHEPADHGAIRDGLSYELPFLLPRQVAEAARRSGTLDRLMESARASFRFQFDMPQRDATDLPVQMPVEDPLREWDWATREYVLSQTHAAYQRNPIAKRGVKYSAAFVVGEGFNLNCKNPDVDAVLKRFIDNPDNAIRKYERQAVIDLLVDGEIVLRLYRAGGDVVAAPMRPWELRWIRTEPGFFRRKLSYHFERYLTQGDAPFGAQRTEREDVDAADVLFVTINNHGYELRGRPELYAILPWLRAHKEWLENRARLNYWRSALLFHVKLAGASLPQLVAAAARWRRPPAPGTVAVTSDRETVEAVTPTIGANDAADDGRQIKLMSAVGLGIPEYMLADGFNANLATATAQQFPALMTFADLQDIVIEELWYPLFSLVVQSAVDAGELPEDVPLHDADGDPLLEEVTDRDGKVTGQRPRMIAAVDAFDVSYAPNEDANKLTIAQSLEIAARSGWVDDETATTEMGFDYGIVQKRLERQRERDAEHMARGLMPQPPTDDAEDEDGDEE